MKKLLSTLTLLCTSIVLLAQSPDCLSAQTGTFALEAEGKIIGEIIRTYEYQLERYPDQKVECRFKIEWIDDCTFRLKQDSCNKAGQMVMGGNAQDVIIKITGVEGNTVHVIGYVEDQESPRLSYVQRRLQ